MPMPYHEDRELPSLSFRQIDLPEIVEWEVNGEYYLVVKVEMTGKRNNAYLSSKEDKGKIEGDFKVLNVKAVGHEPVDVKSIEKREFEKVIAKAKSNIL